MQFHTYAIDKRTLSQWGVEQAEKYVRELWSTRGHAASDSSKSVDMSDVRRGYRKSGSGSHVIFFKVTDDGSDVVRILHQIYQNDVSRNASALLDEHSTAGSCATPQKNKKAKLQFLQLGLPPLQGSQYFSQPTQAGLCATGYCRNRPARAQ